MLFEGLSYYLTNLSIQIQIGMRNYLTCAKGVANTVHVKATFLHIIARGLAATMMATITWALLLARLVDLD